MPRNKSSSRFLEIINDFSDLFSSWDCYDGFTKRDSCVLSMLMTYDRQNRKLTTSDISDMMGITKSAVSQVLKKLEQGGYVKRTVNQSDRRVVYVTLTKKGRDKINAQYEIFLSYLDNVLDKMKDEEVKQLIDCTAKFLKYAKGESYEI